MNELTTAIFIISLALNGLLAGGYIEEYRKNTYREEVHQHGQKLAKKHMQPSKTNLQHDACDHRIVKALSWQRKEGISPWIGIINPSCHGTA